MTSGVFKLLTYTFNQGEVAMATGGFSRHPSSYQRFPAPPGGIPRRSQAGGDTHHQGITCLSALSGTSCQLTTCSGLFLTSTVSDLTSGAQPPAQRSSSQGESATKTAQSICSLNTQVLRAEADVNGAVSVLRQVK